MLLWGPREIRETSAKVREGSAKVRERSAHNCHHHRGHRHRHHYRHHRTPVCVCVCVCGGVSRSLVRVFGSLFWVSTEFLVADFGSQTFAHVSRISRGSRADPIATTRGHSFFFSRDTIKQIIIVRGYLLNHNCPKGGPFLFVFQHYIYGPHI